MASISLEIPNNDAEALLRFLKNVDTQKACPGDPYERSRLQDALEAIVDVLEQDLR